MEFKSSQQRELTLHILQQIKSAILDLQEWNKDIDNQDDLQHTSGGMQKLAGNCMLIQAIGEGVKQIDKRTEGQLLPMKPEIPWKQVMGMRDRISHGYFEIDVEYIDDIIKNDLDTLLTAIEDLIKIVTIV